MRRFILDLDDTLANTTRDLQGDPKRIPQLTLVPGASEFLKTHRGQCILLTAGVAEDQRKKIEALAIRKYFRSIHIVQRPEHKPQKLEEIVRSVEKRLFGISPLLITVIGDRLDIEIRKARELGCVTVRLKIPGGRHSGKMAKMPFDLAHFEVKDFKELMKYPYFGS